MIKFFVYIVAFALVQAQDGDPPSCTDTLAVIDGASNDVSKELKYD